MNDTHRMSCGCLVRGDCWEQLCAHHQAEFDAYHTAAQEHRSVVEPGAAAEPNTQLQGMP